MYIRSITIKNLKRLRNLSLEFTQLDGSPRMWTVLIGGNGTGKTSILQAIALVAPGSLRINDLAGSAFTHLIDRRHKAALDISATFSFTPSSLLNRKCHPLIDGAIPGDLSLVSEVSLKQKETSLRAHSRYESATALNTKPADPLDQARATESPLWAQSAPPTLASGIAQHAWPRA